MKTPEELAQEWIDENHRRLGCAPDGLIATMLREAFLAGFAEGEVYDGDY